MTGTARPGAILRGDRGGESSWIAGSERVEEEPPPSLIDRPTAPMNVYARETTDEAGAMMDFLFTIYDERTSARVKIQIGHVGDLEIN